MLWLLSHPVGHGRLSRGEREETADPSTALPPDFLSNLVGSASFMRLSLRKAAHVAVVSAARRKSGVRFGRDDKGKGGVSIRIRCRLRELQIPPLRFASVGMTKGRAAFPSESDAG
jgi:hypothetical protein